MTFDVEAVSSAYFLISRSEGSIDGGRDSHPWVRRIPWRREGQHALVLLPGESHGQRSRASSSPRGHKESDTTEWLSDWTTLSKGLPRRLSGWRACNAGDVVLIPGLGRSPEEGNDNPLQYSCLKNPMDRGARRATVHGVTKSGAQLKVLAQHGSGQALHPTHSQLCL